MERRGGKREGAGAPKGNLNATKHLNERRKKRQWSAYAEDEAIVQWLIEHGYAENSSEVIRKAIREAKSNFEKQNLTTTR